MITKWQIETPWTLWWQSWLCTNKKRAVPWGKDILLCYFAMCQKVFMEAAVKKVDFKRKAVKAVMWIYIYIYIYTHTDENRILFCSFTTPQTFWQSSAPGPLTTLMTSVVLYSLTRATLMSPGKDEARVSGCIRSEFIHWALSRTLMKAEHLFVRSPHHKYFGKAQHLVLWALWWHQLFSTL